MAKTVGRKVAIRFESVTDAEDEANQGPATKAPRMQQLRDSARSVPLVKRAIADLGAQLLPNADPGFGAAFAEVFPANGEE